MIEIVRSTQRNAGTTATCASAGRRRHARRRATVPTDLGYRDLAKLVIAIERHALLVAPKDEIRPGGHRARYRLTVTHRDRRRSSTTIRTTSPAPAQPASQEPI